MNTREPQTALPALPEERVAAIEEALFADIARERQGESVRRRRRGRWWVAGGAAAAVILIAAVIAPNLSGVVGVGGSSGGDAIAPEIAPGFAGDGDSGGAVDAADGGGAATEDSGDDAAGEREMITTASATLVVADVGDAARAIGEAAESRDGYVESLNVDAAASEVPDGAEPGMTDDQGVSYPYPYPPGGAWITVRVPADALTGLIDELDRLGEVTTSTISRQDVTDQAIDLRARIDAAQASVDRLMDLMSEAGDLSDLIAAEAALSERQAMLESYQQELEWVERQVAMSSLTVSLTPDVEIVEADPAGFGDGLAAGWNGLIATLNGIVVALGFLTPWIAVVGAGALIVWAVLRAVRGRRRTRDDAAAE
ncbi:DUF4349 domain-containing protein [Microbacterium sp. ARD31]|uniref:DUF4349 domain-containing protein n=1 Tax=Microbacterium sp. ARD31 TaxID=2962576 RepID=UPI0028828C76|nr:DUF4349 domain-containing protein [Microbacterium sp. ARD31]MDT0186350.1 DUF4349 domain-containing protein [Microbacterium sp. ARD31]